MTKSWLSKHVRTLFLTATLGFTELVLVGYAFGFYRHNCPVGASHLNPIVASPLTYILNSVTDPLVAYAHCFREDFGIFFLVALAAASCFLRLPLRKTVSVLCAFGVELAAVIGVLDPQEFNLHVTTFQARYKIAPWFTNADLLVVSSCVLALTIAWPIAKPHLPRLPTVRLPVRHRLKWNRLSIASVAIAVMVLFAALAVYYATYNPAPTRVDEKQPIKFMVAGHGPSVNVTLTGCDVSPTSVAANGALHVVTALSDCTITATFSKTNEVRYVAGRSIVSLGPGCFETAGTAINGGQNNSYYSEYEEVSSLPIYTCLCGGTCAKYVSLLYRQVLVTVSYNLTGGGTSVSPVFTYSTLGRSTSVVLGANGTTFWADDAPFSFTNLLNGSTRGTRWVSTTAPEETINFTSLVITYHPQFYVTVVEEASGVVIGGLGSGWRSGGVSITLKAQPLQGHQFVKWSSSTPLITIANPDDSNTTATIDGEGTITAMFS